MTLTEQGAFYFEQLKPEAQQDYLQEVVEQNGGALFQQLFDVIMELTEEECSIVLAYLEKENIHAL